MTPLWLRIWHWSVAVLFVVLVLTGIVLTYSTSEFALMDYAVADKLHQILGIAFSILFGVYAVAVVTTAHWRRYQRQWFGLRARIRLHGAYVVDMYKESKGEDVSQTRVDATRGLLFLCQQLLSITSVVVLSPLLILTGLVLLWPELAPDEIGGLDGLWTLALSHYWAGLAGLIFLVFHAYIATVGGLKRMIKGR